MRWKGNIRDGIKAEDGFAELFKEVEYASFSEDIHEHWDLSVEGLRIDVKALKRTKRSGTKNEKYQWIELQNVRGRKGWLYGNAHFIAFEKDSSWILVDREVLVDFVDARVADEFADFPLYKKKTREGRKDVITLVLTADLEQIGIKIDKNVLKQESSDSSPSYKDGLRSWHIIYFFIRQGKRLSHSLLS